MPEKTFSTSSKHHAILRREPCISELFHVTQTSATASFEALWEAESVFTTVRKKFAVHLHDEEQFLFPVGVSLANGETPDACEDLKARLEEMESEYIHPAINALLYDIE